MVPDWLSRREMEERAGKLPAKIELVVIRVEEEDRMYKRDGDGWQLLSNSPVCRSVGL